MLIAVVMVLSLTTTATASPLRACPEGCGGFSGGQVPMNTCRCFSGSVIKRPNCFWGEDNNVTVVTSRAELSSYFELTHPDAHGVPCDWMIYWFAATARYDDEFFVQNRLVLFSFVFNVSGGSFEVDRINYNGDIVVKPIGGFPLNAGSNWFGVIELKKNDFNPPNFNVVFANSPYTPSTPLQMTLENGVIHLHNPTDTAVSTRGLYLTNNNDLLKWQMPAVIIRAGQTVQVRANSDSVTPVLKHMTANFDLRNGDILRLADVRGNVLAMITVTACQCPTAEPQRSRCGSCERGVCPCFCQFYCGGVGCPEIELCVCVCPLPTGFAITLDPQGGVLESAVFRTDVDGRITELPPAPTNRIGHVFGGWFTQPTEGGTRILASQHFPHQFTEDTTIYARWNPIRIRFNPMNVENWTGNTGNQEQTFTVNSQGRLDALMPVTRTGFDFVGWYTHPVSGELITEETVFTSCNAADYELWGTHIEVYARWVSNRPGTFTITLDQWQPIIGATTWSTPSARPRSLVHMIPATLATDTNGRLVLPSLPQISNGEGLTARGEGWSSTPDTRLPNLRWHGNTTAVTFTEDTTVYAVWHEIWEIAPA
jgi:uncharacterized repeat protein (TIGR02543 family)